MRRLLPPGVLFLGGLLVMSQGTAADGPPRYPQTKRIDHTDDYHGTKVADPYRWLEDDVRKSKDVADWVEAENKVTDRLPRSDPRARAPSRNASRNCGTTRSTPPRSRHGGRYFFTQERRPAKPGACSTSAIRSTASRASCSIRTTGRRTAPSPWPAVESATTASISPTAWPRPAPTGRPGTCWTSPPASRWPTS